MTRTTPAPPDAALDWAAEVWRANPPLARAVSLPRFLADPHAHIEAHLAATVDGDADDAPRPLLPAQRAAAHRLALRERPYGPSRAGTGRAAAQAANAADRALPPGAVRRGPGFVEPVRHHAYAVSRHPERRRR